MVTAAIFNKLLVAGPGLLETRLELGIEAAVDEHVQYAANLARAVAPRVIGATLDHDISRFQLHDPRTTNHDPRTGGDT